MKKTTVKLLLIFLLSQSINTISLAAESTVGGTIIPGLSSDIPDCDDFFKTYTDKEIEESFLQQSVGGVLACAVKTGRVKLYMIPYFIKYLAEFLIALAGIVCMFFIVLGGYYYVFGGIGGDQEKGKKAILYACVGLIITSLAWIIVNVVLFAVSR